MNPGYHFLSSEVWAAYLDFMFIRKFLAFSMCAFSVSSWLCCLSWSRSLSRLTSWVWQPFPSQEKHRRMLVACRSHISRAEVQACEEACDHPRSLQHILAGSSLSLVGSFDTIYLPKDPAQRSHFKDISLVPWPYSQACTTHS